MMSSWYHRDINILKWHRTWDQIKIKWCHYTWHHCDLSCCHVKTKHRKKSKQNEQTGFDWIKTGFEQMGAKLGSCHLIFEWRHHAIIMISELSGDITRRIKSRSSDVMTHDIIVTSSCHHDWSWPCHLVLKWRHNDITLWHHDQLCYFT